MAYHILVLNWQDITHPLGGGAEVHLQEIFKRIAASGHKVTFLSCRHPGAMEDETIDGIRIFRHGSRGLFNYHVPFLYKKLHREYKFDIVVDAINKVPLFTPLYVRNTPLLTIVHHLFRKTIFSEASFPAALYVYLMESMIGKVYRRNPFCVISDSTRRDVESFGIPQGKISLIDICVDHDLYKPDLQAKSPEPVISYLGRIKKYKSVDQLLNAFAIIKAQIPEAKLNVVGDGDDVPRLKQIARDMKLKDIQFLGFVSPEEKVRYLQQSHLVVNTSSKEGWGLTVIEANACGTIVVASDVEGLRDSVVDGETGLLYPYGDIQSLADNSVRILKDAALRRKMEQNALTWAARFHWDKSAMKTLELIDNVINAYPKIPDISDIGSGK